MNLNKLGGLSSHSPAATILNFLSPGIQDNTWIIAFIPLHSIGGEVTDSRGSKKISISRKKSIIQFQWNGVYWNVWMVETMKRRRRIMRCRWCVYYIYWGRYDECGGTGCPWTNKRITGDESVCVMSPSKFRPKSYPYSRKMTDAERRDEK